MLAPEDLTDLGAELRRADTGIDVAAQQLLAAQRLLLRLAAEGALPPDRIRLESFLAPVFCTSALQQKRFGPAYRSWLRKRFPQEAESVPSEPARPPLPPPPPRRRWVKPALASFALAAALAAWFSWQHWRPREVVGQVLADGHPVAGAQVSVLDRTVRTGADGGYRLGFRAAELPAMIRAVTGESLQAEPLAPVLQQARWTLYFGAALEPERETLNLEFRHEAAPGPAPGESPKPQLTETAPIQPELVERYAPQGLAPPGWSERIRPPSLLAALAPLLLFLGWFLWQMNRRQALQRRASRTPKHLSEVHLPGGVRAVAPGFPLRRLAQELRRRRIIESDELRIEPTIAATLRRGGVFTAVRGSRAEPDYFALIDRASLSDHQARLSAEIVANLARSDVLVERYDFDRDATVCRVRDTHLMPKLHPKPEPGRTMQPHAVRLAGLRERFPLHRVLVFGNGEGCFDGFTGAPAPWLATLLSWPFVALITPVPAERWGRREQALARLGVEVLPLTGEGLARLIHVIAGSARETAIPAGGIHGLHERTPRRWLERHAPPEGVIRALCDDLRADLGERGFAWLAACAGYPEIHWGITLRLGDALVPDAAEFERLLPRLARLPWFREAYMPDWLRAALLVRLSNDDDARVRDRLRDLLAAFAPGAGAEELPLRIATGAPTRTPGRWQSLLEDLARWWRRRNVPGMVRQAEDDSPLRDYVFLRFLSGRSLGRLELAAPGGLTKVVRASRRAMLAPAFVGLCAVLATSGALWTLFPPYDRLEYSVWSRGMRFAHDGSRLAFVSSVSATADGAPITRAQALSVVPTAPSRLSGAQTPVAGSALMLAPNYERWAAVREDGGLSLRVEGGSIWDDEARERITVLAFAEDSRRAAVGFGDGSVRVYDLSSSTAANRIVRDRPDRSGEITALTFSEDGKTLASGGRFGTLAVVAEGRGWLSDVITGTIEPGGLALDPAGGMLASATGDAVRLWNLSTDGKTISPKLDGTVRGLAFAPDGGGLAVATSASAALILDPATAQPVAKLVGHAEPVEAVAYSPDGRFVATVDGAGTTRLWNPASGQLAAGPLVPEIPRRSGAPPPDLAFSRDGTLLAVAVGAGVSLYRLPAAVAAPAAPAGVWHALMIANDYRYSGSPSPQESPRRDARNVGAILEERFGFRVSYLENRSRDEMLKALEALAGAAGPADRIVLYLSGIATEDAGRYAFVAHPPGRAADIDPRRDYVQGDEILGRLGRMRARAALVLADTPSAALLASARSTATQPPERSGARMLISSALRGEMPLDTPREAGSPFAVAVADSLREAGPGYAAGALFEDVRRRMAADKLSGKQRPAFYRLPAAGDDGGIFLFPDPSAPASTAPTREQTPPKAVATGEPVVPDLVRLELRAAEQALRDANLKVGRVTVAGVRTDGAFTERSVRSQKPEPGTRVARGASVDLVLAEPGVRVPSLVKLPLREAQTRLEKAGLALGKVDEQEAAGTSTGIVLEQRQPAGRWVARASAVDLVVSAKASAERIPVPDVRGIDVKQASALLVRTGFATPVLVQVTTKSDRVGIVLEQNPAPGTLVARGSRISLRYVSSAPGASCTHPSGLRSGPGQISTKITFRNLGKDPVDVFWIDYECTERRYFSLQPGAMHVQQTYASHAWIARDAATGRQLTTAIAAAQPSTVDLGAPSGAPGAPDQLRLQGN